MLVLWKRIMPGSMILLCYGTCKLHFRVSWTTVFAAFIKISFSVSLILKTSIILKIRIQEATSLHVILLFNQKYIYMTRLHGHDRMCICIPEFFDEGSKPHLMLRFNFTRTMKLQWAITCGFHFLWQVCYDIYSKPRINQLLHIIHLIVLLIAAVIKWYWRLIIITWWTLTFVLLAEHSESWLRLPTI